MYDQVWRCCGDEQIFSLYLVSVQHGPSILYNPFPGHIPFIVYCLDDEPQSWADSIDILPHDLLDNGCLACIVQASIMGVSILHPSGNTVRIMSVALTASKFAALYLSAWLFSRWRAWCKVPQP